MARGSKHRPGGSPRIRPKTRPEQGEGTEADRRRTILRAAINVFAKKGYHGCRIADVAREAKVAYGLVYHYFQDKEELLRSVFEVGWGGFVERITAALEGDATVEEKVHRLVQVAFDAYRSDPGAVRVLILEIARSPGLGRTNRNTVFVEAIGLGRAMFERAKANGELRADADPLLCAAALFGQLEMALTTFAVGMVPNAERSALDRAPKQVAEWFLRGVLR